MPLIESNDYLVLLPKRQAQKIMGGLLLFCAMLITLHPWWMPLMGAALIVDEPPQPAAAIVVLGGGSGDRERTGARLYQAGYAPRVITLGAPLGIPSLSDVPFAKLSADYLMMLGVPASAIQQLPQSISTCDEARFTLAALPAGANRIIVVTDPFHTRRARWLFTSFARQQVEVITVAASPSWFNPYQWWQEDRGIIFTTTEYLKFISILVRGCNS